MFSNQSNNVNRLFILLISKLFTNNRTANHKLYGVRRTNNIRLHRTIILINYQVSKCVPIQDYVNKLCVCRFSELSLLY